jgi:hypothetical protein
MTFSVVIARLVRAIQYPRDVRAQAEKPQRTGLPAFAGNDSQNAVDSQDAVAPLPLPNGYASAFSRHQLPELC